MDLRIAGGTLSSSGSSLRATRWTLLAVSEFQTISRYVVNQSALKPSVGRDLSVRGLLDRERRSRRVDFSAGASHTTRSDVAQHTPVPSKASRVNDAAGGARPNEASGW
jgi:hypothetical protein